MKGLIKILWESYNSVRYNPYTGKLKPFYRIACGYIAIPLIIFCMLLWYGFRMGNDMITAFVGFLSLFVALIFQVIYIATDKFTSRYNDSWAECVRTASHDEPPQFKEDVNGYLIRHGNFTKLFVRQLTFVLILSIVMIALSVIEKLYHGDRLNIVLSSLMMSMLYLWLVYLVHSIKSIYTLLMDDINSKMEKL